MNLPQTPMGGVLRSVAGCYNSSQRLEFAHVLRGVPPRVVELAAAGDLQHGGLCLLMGVPVVAVGVVAAQLSEYAPVPVIAQCARLVFICKCANARKHSACNDYLMTHLPQMYRFNSAKSTSAWRYRLQTWRLFCQRMCTASPCGHSGAVPGISLDVRILENIHLCA